MSNFIIQCKPYEVVFMLESDKTLETYTDQKQGYII